ncbi:TPA: hypothetical protein ACQSRZ_006014 [Pseudomonas aeruginosa]
MDREGTLYQLKSSVGADGIYMAQPLDGFVGLAALDGEADMFYLVTPWAERYQSIQALDEPVVIVVPDFMALDRMVRASV